MIRDADRRGILTVRRRCELLEVSRGGYYRWLARPDRGSVDVALRILVGELHRRWHGLLGYRRMHDMLRLQGVETSQRKVRGIMRKGGLRGRPSGRRSRYRGRSGPPVADDLLRRDFTAEAPNRRWVSDITEFATLTGKLYLCQVKDLYDGVVAGWSMDVRAESELVLRAVSMAWRERVEGGGKIVLHSDRGTQYTSARLSEWLSDHGVVASMGAVGTSADNASAESFFGLLKRDLAHAIRDVPRSEAMVRISDYIVNLHNPLRRAPWRRVPQNKLAVMDASETEIEKGLFHDLVEENG